MTAVYVATSLSRVEEYRHALDLLRRHGFTITHDWSERGSVESEGNAAIREVAAQYRAGVERADIMIVMLPGGRGTHTELGLALAFGIPVILVAPSVGGSDALKQDGRTCCFYMDPQIRIVRTLDLAIKLAVEMRG